MKTCRMCRYAERGDVREERICRCADGRAAFGPVRADAMACGAYAVSAWSYLESVARAQERMEDMSWRAQRYREMAGRATGSSEALRVSGTGAHSKVADNMDRCMDIARDIQRQAEQLRERYAIACAMMEDVESAEGRRVLELRHLSRRTWEQIAGEMGYDVRQVQRIHRRALSDMQAQMERMGIKA